MRQGLTVAYMKDVNKKSTILSFIQSDKKTQPTGVKKFCFLDDEDKPANALLAKGFACRDDSSKLVRVAPS